MPGGPSFFGVKFQMGNGLKWLCFTLCVFRIMRYQRLVELGLGVGVSI